MRLPTLLKKIKAITPDEVGFRTKKMIQEYWDRRHFKQESQRIHADDFVFWTGDDLSPLRQSAQKNRAPVWKRRFFLNGRDRAEDASFFKKYYPREYQISLNRAERILQNRLHFLGIDLHYPDGIDWHRDPLSEYRHPLVYFRDVKIFGGNQGQGDVKHIWEVNRHQYFIELGKAYYLTGQEKYARKIVELFLDWYKKNPYKHGINWSSALEVAVRSLAWLWAFALIRDSEAFTGEVNFLLQKSLYMHQKYLSENLSFYFSPYNHLIGETTALFIINYLFPHFKGADKQQQRAWNILRDQVSFQFHPDGMTVEQTSYYHHFTLGFYLQAVLLRRLNGDPVDSQVLQQLEKSTEIMMYLQRPDGTIPRIGEIDDGLSIYFRDAANWDFRAFQNYGALLFRRPDMKYTAGKFQEDAFWLFGQQGFRDYQKMESRAPEEKVRWFEKSGYLVIRDGWDPQANYLLMDAGPIAHGVRHDEILSSAHGHMDLSSFELHVHGQPIWVDGGHYTYNGPWEWAHYFRRTEAHNTVTVDGETQAWNPTAMKIGFAPHFRVVNFYQSPELITLGVWHDGFRRLKDPVEHERHFIFIAPDVWIFWDNLSGAAAHRVELHLHAHQGIESFQQTENTITIPMAEKTLFTHILYPHMDIRVQKGGKKPDQGWLGENYGVKFPAYYFRASAILNLPNAVLSLHRVQAQKKQWSLTFQESDDVRVWEFNQDQKNVRLILAKRTGMWKWEDVRSDASFMIMCEQQTGLKYYLWKGKKLVVNRELRKPLVTKPDFAIYE